MTKFGDEIKVTDEKVLARLNELQEQKFAAKQAMEHFAASVRNTNDTIWALLVEHLGDKIDLTVRSYSYHSDGVVVDGGPHPESWRSERRARRQALNEDQDGTTEPAK